MHKSWSFKDIKNLTDYKDEAAAKKAIKDGDVGGIYKLSEASGQIKATYVSWYRDEWHYKGSNFTEITTVTAGCKYQPSLSANQVKLLSRGLILRKNWTKKKEAKETKQLLQQQLVWYCMILIVYTSSTAQEQAKRNKDYGGYFLQYQGIWIFYGRIIGILAVILDYVGIYVIGAEAY